MQAADAVPLGGVAAEVILGRGDTRRAHAGEALTIAGDDGIGGIKLVHQVAHELRLGAALGTAEERPRPFAEPLDEPRLGQQLEVAGDPRLRLSQDFGEL